MKKIISAFLLVILCLLVGCTPVDAVYPYELDLGLIQEEMNIEAFDISLIRIKYTDVNGEVTYIACNESMFTEDDYNKLQTVGTHTVTVIYKLLKAELTITLYEDTTNPIVGYELDINTVPGSIEIDDFDMSLIMLIEKYQDGSTKHIICNEEMLSSEDCDKLKTIGTHNITIKYKDYEFEVVITLFEDVIPETYEYELDLGYLRDETLVDDFNLNLIIIKEIDSQGNIRYIECDKSMVSTDDYNKLQTVGTHTITINYNDFTAQVTIKLISINQDTPVYDVFNSNSSYYASANGKSGTELKLSLRTIISKVTKNTTYGDLRTDIGETDVDPNNSNNIILFYTRKSVPKKWDNGNTWNREHVWPQSLGWFKTSGAGSDLHHLRPTDPGENSRRGNKKFGDYIPKDEVKGDIARIIFYLMVRYSEADKYTFTTVATSKELLLQWHQLDPVDEFEINRNETTYQIQGNRNPFIDHPECVALIWGITNKLNNVESDVYSIEIVFYLEEKRKYEFL